MRLPCPPPHPLVHLHNGLLSFAEPTFLPPQESRYLWPALSVLISTRSKTARW